MTETTNDLERAMLDSARRGDSLAFGELARLHWRTIVRSARRIVGEEHLAQDLAQEALIRAFRRMRAMVPGTRFGVWVGRIARNIAVDRIRRRQAAPKVELIEPDGFDGCCAVAEAPPSTDGDCDGARIWSALSELSEAERTFIVLRYARGMRIEQIARECGTSVGAVKARLYRGRARLARAVF